MKKLNLINYIGGKYFLVDWLLKYIPEHKKYVEVFGGGGGNLLLNKEKTQIEVFNDINANVFTLFKVLREKPDEFMKVIGYTLYDLNEFNYCKNNINNINNEIEKARMFYVLCNCSLSSKLSVFNISSVRNRALIFNNKKSKLSKIINRLKNVYILNWDYRKVLDFFDDEDTFFYLDPPYLANDRKSITKYYKHELTTEQEHIELLEKVLNLKGKIMISSYENELYDKYLLNNGWSKKTKQVKLYSQRTKQNRDTKTEAIYLNYILSYELF